MSVKDMADTKQVNTNNYNVYDTISYSRNKCGSISWQEHGNILFSSQSKDPTYEQFISLPTNKNT